MGDYKTDNNVGLDEYLVSVKCSIEVIMWPFGAFAIFCNLVSRN